jgi:hypothetical protein
VCPFTQWKQCGKKYKISIFCSWGWVRLLIQKLWEVAWDPWEHCNEVVHKKDNVVTQEEAEQLKGWVRKAIRIGQGLVLTGDQYLFHNITVDSAFKWTLAKKKHWKQFVEIKWKA